MTWVMWALAVAVVGGCVVVASGRGGGLREVYDDRRDVLVPGHRPMAADDVRAVRFTTAVRGYRMIEVDALLARLAAEMDARDQPRAGPGDDAGPARDVTGDGDVTAFPHRSDEGGRAR